MLWELLAAAGLGVVALWLVFQPLLWPSVDGPAVYEPVDPGETPRGVALAALKELEFDRETGKVSEQDYRLLHARYTAEALEALRADDRTDDIEAMIAARVRGLRSGAVGVVCAQCGRRPEPDAVFCSSCGRRLG